MKNLQIVSSSKTVEAQYVELMVPLYSNGCDRKIKKALSTLRGIYSVDVDHELQKVTVWGICDKFHVLRVVRCKRRDARFWDQNDGVLFFEEEEVDASSSSRVTSKFVLATARSLSREAWSKIVRRMKRALINGNINRAINIPRQFLKQDSKS